MLHLAARLATPLLVTMLLSACTSEPPEVLRAIEGMGRLLQECVVTNGSQDAVAVSDAQYAHRLDTCRKANDKVMGMFLFRLQQLSNGVVEMEISSLAPNIILGSRTWYQQGKWLPLEKVLATRETSREVCPQQPCDGAALLQDLSFDNLTPATIFEVLIGQATPTEEWELNVDSPDDPLHILSRADWQCLRLDGACLYAVRQEVRLLVTSADGV